MCDPVVLMGGARFFVVLMIVKSEEVVDCGRMSFLEFKRFVFRKNSHVPRVGVQSPTFRVSLMG